MSNLSPAERIQSKLASGNATKAWVGRHATNIANAVSKMTKLTDDDKLALSAMELKRAESGGRGYVRMSAQEIEAYKAKAKSSGFHAKFWSDPAKSGDLIQQIAGESRDPRLYSNIKGMLTGKSRNERVAAHGAYAAMGGNDGTVLGAMRAGIKKTAGELRELVSAQMKARRRRQKATGDKTAGISGMEKIIAGTVLASTLAAGGAAALRARRRRQAAMKKSAEEASRIDTSKDGKPTPASVSVHYKKKFFGSGMKQTGKTVTVYGGLAPKIAGLIGTVKEALNASTVASAARQRGVSPAFMRNMATHRSSGIGTQRAAELSSKMVNGHAGTPSFMRDTGNYLESHARSRHTGYFNTMRAKSGDRPPTPLLPKSLMSKAAEMNPHLSHGLELGGLGILAAHPVATLRDPKASKKDKHIAKLEAAGLGVLAVPALHHFGSRALKAMRKSADEHVKIAISRDLANKALRMTRSQLDDMATGTKNIKNDRIVAKFNGDAAAAKAHLEQKVNRFTRRGDIWSSGKNLREIKMKHQNSRRAMKAFGAGAGLFAATGLAAHAYSRHQEKKMQKAAADQVNDDEQGLKSMALMNALRRRPRGALIAGDVNARNGTAVEAMQKAVRK